MENAIAQIDAVAALIGGDGAFDKYKVHYSDCLVGGTSANTPQFSGGDEAKLRWCVQGAFDVFAQNAASSGASGAKGMRNEVVGRLMIASNQACARFTQRMNSFQSGTNFWAGSLATALAGAGAIVTTANTARMFAGLAGVASGVRAEFNADIFYQQVVPALRKAIDVSRDSLRTSILGHFREDYDIYPMPVAFAEVIRYNDACSLVGALATMSEKLVLAEHPGLDAFNRAQVLANAGRYIAANPGDFVNFDNINTDGTVKTTKPTARPGAVSPQDTAKLGVGDVVDIERALCVSTSGNKNRSVTREAVNTYLTQRIGVSAAGTKRAAGDAITDDDYGILKIATAAVPSCVAAGFLNAFEVAKFGVPVSDQAKRISDFQNVLNASLAAATKAGKLDTTWGFSATDPKIEVTGKMDQATRMAIAAVQSSGNKKPADVSGIQNFGEVTAKLYGDRTKLPLPL